MPITKRHGPSPWEVTEFHTPGALAALPDDLPDARLLTPAPPVEDVQRGYRLLATAVVTQARHDLARQAAEDWDAAREALQRLTGQEPWSLWLGCRGREPEVLCEALTQRLERGEVLAIPRAYPETMHGAAAAADSSCSKERRSHMTTEEQVLALLEVLAYPSRGRGLEIGQDLEGVYQRYRERNPEHASRGEEAA